jgi:hypothetical protein
MSNKKIVFIVATLVLGLLTLICLIISIGAYFFAKEIRMQSISNFEECVNAGYPTLDTYPRQCMTSDGRTFVEDIADPDYLDYPEVSTIPSDDDVSLYYPVEGNTISSPLNIDGETVGSWYWEGTFRIELRSKTGDVISSTFATSEGEWMQQGYVPFTATMIFETDEKVADLVFIKENPSGMPENEDEYSIAVNIHTGSDGCVITGCSSHICSEEETFSTCEFLDHYACYKNAICERQVNGLCGWTQTPELLECIEDNPPPVGY